MLVGPIKQACHADTSKRLVNSVMTLLHGLRYSLIVVLVVGVLALALAASSSQECDASYAACPREIAADTAGYTYSGGASAQTYKPGAPIKRSICDTDDGSKGKTKYKVARWPLTRRTYPSSPVVRIVGKAHSCDATTGSDTCASSPEDNSNSRPIHIAVEVWHARPDGTYSSLRPGIEEGECRATIVSGADGTFHIQTLAPGSVGMFSGIGPRGMDLPPYGPPVINFFIQAQGHAPLLANVPVTAKSFYGPDLRIPVMFGSGGNGGDTSAQITSWNVLENGDITLSIDFFLAKRSSDGGEGDATSLADTFCSSWFHGSPASLFVEPIAVCAPSLLDFFEL